MTEVLNPYAKALDGLVLDDPVSSFFDFCKEREKIRKEREVGNSPPWSSDPIFQKGRFLNVFREDDRGSKAILNFAQNLGQDLQTLVHALFFARWCNRQETLDQLSYKIISRPRELQEKIEQLNPWCNSTAYPVESINWEGKEYSRLDAAIKLFGKIKDPLTEIVKESKGSVIRATDEVNTLFGMQNDFPIFMAIMDIAWFRPDIIDPSSHVPTGIGAVAYLNLLQEYLGLDNHQQTAEEMIKLQNKYWPEAKRSFEPIDIEYLSCECRKYYSYINGTKLFEGKNVFHQKK
tara:strand:+ start:172 stop:1044 length:873 start_codon:yes stop_codon:yes gene_type:complete